jgi:hypothetical protein
MRMPRSKSPIKTRLDAWRLKRVPFPATPFVEPFNVDPLRNGSVFAPDLRATEIAKIRQSILKQGYAGMVKPWSWMWAKKKIGGSLGIGKTALLIYIADQINQDYGRKFFGLAAHWLAVYVPIQPSTKSVQEMASLALASVCNTARGASVERLLLGRLRRKVIVLSPHNEYTQPVRDAADNRFLDDKWLLDHGVDLPRLSAKIQTHLRDHKVTVAFAEALSTGQLEQFLSTVNGDPNLTPPRPALAKRALSLLLNDLARTASAAEIKQITFFLDDFYYLVRRTPLAERIPLAAELRAFAVTGGGYAAVKENIFDWVAVMHTQTASTFNAAWESADLHKVAPLKLDTESSVVLPQFPVSRGREFLTTYLMYQRPARPPYDTFPFSPEALDKIAQFTAEETKGAEDVVEPRSLLVNAFEVMSQALLLSDEAMQALQPSIGVDFVAHVLAGAPLPVSRVDDEEIVPDSERKVGSTTACPCNCHQDDAQESVYDVIQRVLGTTGAIAGYYCATCGTPVPLESDIRA